MRKIVSLIVFLFISASAQPPSADALQAAIPGLQGRERLVALHELVNKLEAKAPQEALAFAAEGLALARKEGDQEKEAAFLSSTSFCYSQLGDFSLAVQFGKESLELSQRIGHKERIAKAHNTLGITYTFMGLYSQALEEHLESLRIREELSLETASIQSLNNIGILYHNIGEYNKAIEYYNKILQRIDRNSNNSSLILIKLNIGFAEYKLGRLTEALRHHQEALVLIQKNNNATLIAYAYLNLGMTYTDLKQFDQARYYLLLSLKEYEKQNQKHGQVQVLNALGRMYLLTGAYGQAIPYARAGAALAHKIKARNELKTSYELISDLYGKQGNISKSYEYFKLYTVARDSIYSIQESNKIADTAMNIMFLTKDNEIESLKKEQMISLLKVEKQHYISLVFIFGLIFLAIIIFLLIRSNNKVRFNKKTLENANGELEKLNIMLHEKVHEIKTLSGLLPICAQCKKIRNDSGYWEQLEGYISEHTTATFSHGICPHCAEILYPGVTQKMKNHQPDRA